MASVVVWNFGDWAGWDGLFFGVVPRESPGLGEKAGAGPFRAQGRGKRVLLRAEVGALPEFEEQVPVGAPRRELALRLQILARKGGEVLAVAVGPVYLRFGRLAIPVFHDEENYRFEIGKGEQITEGNEDRDRFALLQKVGMDQKQVRRAINSQVLWVFFLPLGATLLHMVFASRILSRMLGAFNMSDWGLTLTCAGFVSLGFALLYWIAYLLTARVYYRIVRWTAEVRPC